MKPQEQYLFMEKLLITYCPCPDEDTASALAKHLLDLQLAGCAQILPGVRSLYQWDGKLQEDTEYVLLIKSIERTAQPILNYLEEAHPYDCPCIIQQSVSNCNDAYQAWMLEQCSHRPA